MLTEDEARHLIERIDTSHVVGLRDRALIAVMVYGFARVGAVVGMTVEDYFPQSKRWWFRLHEKGGKLHELPAHHKAEEFLDAYLEVAGLRDETRAPLFRTAVGMTRRDVYRMVQRRAGDAGIATRIGCHFSPQTLVENHSGPALVPTRYGPTQRTEIRLSQMVENFVNSACQRTGTTRYT